VAKHQRPAPKSKPVTANPLFPAVVALWFGAAFGGGTAALRTSLVEAFVLRTHIDLIVPAAAPPLGITARLLLALLMAALGTLVGAAIGRRLARPRFEVRERKRSARNNEAGPPRVHARDRHSEAPARKPISAHEEFGNEDALAEPVVAAGILASRRRALTVETEQPSFVPQELAPLPGGQPQILDLAGAELDQEEALAAPAPTAAQVTDLNAYADGGDSDDGTPLAVADDAGQAPLSAAPTLGDSFDDPAAERQVFAAQPVSDAAAGHGEEHPLSGRQVFGMAPVPPQHPDTRQIFGAPASDDLAPPEAVKSAGFQSSVFDAAPGTPLFAARTESPSAPLDAPRAALPGSAAAPEPLPSVTELGMTDLAVRLQESMKRRRAARAQTAATESLEVAAPRPATDMPVAVRLPAEPARVEAAPPIEPVVAAPAAPIRLPAALRPLSFDDFDDDDTDTLASLLPPRHIAMVPAQPPSRTTQPEPEPEPALMAEAGDGEDDRADEAPYASLLNVNPIHGRASFVRIEEPELAAAPVEPVVIFPGQAPRIALGNPVLSPLSEVAPVVSPENDDTASEFRRFDAPAGAGAGQPIAAAASSFDPEEAERSLRSALANLQRISGAA
jgi:hypothetical protein